MLFHHLLEHSHHALCSFLLHHLDRIHLAGRVVENDQQILVSRLFSQPLVSASVQVHHHSGQRPPSAPGSMRSVPLVLGHKPRLLQRVLDPTVDLHHPVFALQLLVKVLHVEVKVLRSIQPQHLLDFLYPDCRKQMK